MNTRNTYTLITILVILLLLCMKPRAETFSVGGAVRKVRGVVGDAGDSVRDGVAYVGKGTVSGVVDGGKFVVGLHRDTTGMALDGAGTVIDTGAGMYGSAGRLIGKGAGAVGIKKGDPVRKPYTKIFETTAGAYQGARDAVGGARRKVGSRMDKIGGMFHGDKVADKVAKPYGKAYKLGKGIGGFYADGLEIVGDGADNIISGFNLN